MDNLINHIQENNLTEGLISVVQKVWNEIEESVATNRLPRYSE